MSILKEVIEDCVKCEISAKLLQGFEVSSDCEFVFLNKSKWIPSDKLASYGITDEFYDINTWFDSYYKGYWVTIIELKSRKYQWDNSLARNKTKDVRIQTRRNSEKFQDLLKKSEDYKLRMYERRNWRGYLNYIEFYDGKIL
jgi:hypothetical protein